MDPKLALITGANRGLGRSMALHLAAQGVDVIGTYRNNAGEAAEVRTQIEAQGRRAAMLQLDVSRIDSFPDFAAKLGSLLPSTFSRRTFDFSSTTQGSAFTPAWPTPPRTNSTSWSPFTSRARSS